MAVRYGTFRICVLRTLYLQPYRTSVPYFSSIFEAYHTNVPCPRHNKKGVPYQRTLLLSKNWGVKYRTYAPYRTAILASRKEKCADHATVSIWRCLVAENKYRYAVCSKQQQCTTPTLAALLLAIIGGSSLIHEGKSINPPIGFTVQQLEGHGWKLKLMLSKLLPT